MSIAMHTLPESENAVQARFATQESTDGAESANDLSQPNGPVPTPPITDVHQVPVTHIARDIEGPTNDCMQPTAILSAPPIRRSRGGKPGHSIVATQNADAGHLSNNDGQEPSETQGHDAIVTGLARRRMKPIIFMPAPTNNAVHSRHVTHSIHDGVGDDGAQSGYETQKSFSPVIASIIELWRQRQDWHKTEKSMTLRCHAICRRYVGVTIPSDASEAERKKLFTKQAGLGSALLKKIEEGADTGPAAIACQPILAARAPLRKERETLEKHLAKMAKGLPASAVEFVKNTYGANLNTLATIVGECGDIGAYRNPSCLWKRMGLAVINGERQRKKAGVDALTHGFAPERAAVAFTVGSGLIGCMGRGPRLAVGEAIESRDDLSPYQKLFVQRLRLEAERDPAHRREPTVKDDGTVVESFSAHAANRARRYVTKRFLRDLYAAWTVET
jgi:hypothetical protein